MGGEGFQRPSREAHGLDPWRRTRPSVGSRARQRFLHLGAGLGVALHDLLDVLLFLPLQDAQEVLQLGHGEGVPLEEEKSEKFIKTTKNNYIFF